MHSALTPSRVSGGWKGGQNLLARGFHQPVLWRKEAVT